MLDLAEFQCNSYIMKDRLDSSVATYRSTSWKSISFFVWKVISDCGTSFESSNHGVQKYDSFLWKYCFVMTELNFSISMRKCFKTCSYLVLSTFRLHFLSKLQVIFRISIKNSIEPYILQRNSFSAILLVFLHFTSFSAYFLFCVLPFLHTSFSDPSGNNDAVRRMINRRWKYWVVGKHTRESLQQKHVICNSNDSVF
jgi:hypothetical protein